MEQFTVLKDLHNFLLNLPEFEIGSFQVGRIYDQYASIMNSDFVWNIKSVSFVLSVIFLGFVLYLNIKLGKLKSLTMGIISDVVKPIPKNEGGPTIARWEEILRHIESTKELEWRFAVIEADKLMDDTLKKAGFPGQTMGERLKSIEEGQVQSLNLIWEAHKIRNRLAHETNYFLRHAEAKRAVQYYQRALEEFGIL